MSEKLYEIRTDTGAGFGPPGTPRTWLGVKGWVDWLTLNHHFVCALEIYEVEVYGLGPDGEDLYRRVQR